MFGISPCTKLALAIGLALLAVAIFLDFKMTDSNAQKFIAYGTIFGALGAVIVLGFVGYQAIHLKRSIDLQTETFKLEKRPYLYVHLLPLFNYAEGGAMYGGGHVVYKNEGQIPAGDVEISFIAATDGQGEIGIKEWFDQELGGFPEVKTVFPQHVDAMSFIHGAMSSQTHFFFIGALVTYTGIEQNKTYWYKFSQVYNIKGDGKEVNNILIKTDTDWDKNSDVEPSPIAEPDWSRFKDYLGKKIVVGNTDI